MNTLSKVFPFSAIILSLLLLSSTAIATSEYNEECRSYAKEEQVPKEELASYLKECEQYLQNPEQETEATNETETENMIEDLR